MMLIVTVILVCAFFSETYCTQCSAGTFCMAGASSETPCSSGYYSAAHGAASCTICPAGSYCTLTTATTCAPGTYSLGGATSCTKCPAGKVF